MKHIRIIIGFASVTAIAAALLCTVVVPQRALAACSADQQEITLPIDQGGTQCVPKNSNNSSIEENPIYSYLRSILIFLAGGVGLAVVGGIIFGAYMYITARGNAAQTQQGQNVIINAVVGLLLFIFMFAILQFIIPGGIFKI